MIVSTLTSRQKSLLVYLCKQDRAVTVESLAHHSGVSARTIRNDLRAIEAYGHNHTFSLVRKGGEGISLVFSDTDSFSVCHGLEFAETRSYSKQERVALAAAILLSKSTCTYQEIAEQVGVSRQTVISDFDAIDNYFLSERLSVNKSRGHGLRLKGSEMDIRHCFLQLATDSPCPEDVVHMLETCGELNQFRPAADVVISKTEACLGIKFADAPRLEICVSFTLSRLAGGHSIEKPLNVADLHCCAAGAVDIKHLMDSLKADVRDEREREYLCSVILSQGISALDDEAASQQGFEGDNTASHDEAYAISHELISAFRESLGTAEKPPKHTIDFLTVHLRAAISRSKTGIRIQNELTQQVKISIPLIYEFTNKKMSEIEARHGISFDENEIAYIAIYLSTVFQESEAEDISLRILFICSFGIATSTVLKSKIAKMLLGEKLIGPMSREKAREFLKHEAVDLIISTAEFSYADIPVFVVSPLLNPADTDRLRDSLYQHAYAKTCARFLSLYSERVGRDPSHHVSDYVREGDISIVDSCTSWEGAIRQAAAPLLKEGYLEYRYVDKMIQAVNDFGTYMVLTPGVAYVHAGVDDGIKTDCAAILVTRHLLSFGLSNMKKIRAIVVLGIKNRTRSDLLNLASIFEMEENIWKLNETDIDVKAIEDMHD